MSASLYGGTYNLLHYTFPKLGWEVTFIDDPDDLDAWRKAIRPNTRGVLRRVHRQPEERRARLRGRRRDRARQQGIPLIIDNTVTTPYLCRPLDWGADIVLHSATKFIGGHGTSIGGIIVDGGKFDYVASGRFPDFTEPDPSYHGLVFSQLPERAAARAVHPEDPAPVPARPRPGDRAVQLVPVPAGPRDAEPAHGAALRRTRRPSREWLEARDEVEWVAYPGLTSSPWNDRAKKYLPHGKGAILSFGIKGGLEAGRSFVDGLELFSHLANVGDVRSLAIHPATTTHSQLTEAEQATTGVTPDLVRLCVGIETIDDILADLEAGFRARQGGVRRRPEPRSRDWCMAPRR